MQKLDTLAHSNSFVQYGFKTIYKHHESNNQFSNSMHRIRVIEAVQPPYPSRDHNNICYPHLTVHHRSIQCFPLRRASCFVLSVHADHHLDLYRVHSFQYRP
eukprot:175139_1